MVEDVGTGRDQNPFTQLEGYKLLDKDGAEAGEVGETVYDAPSGVLKYLSINGRAVPADSLKVDHEARTVGVPYPAETVSNAPRLEDPSGEFEGRLRGHYGLS